MLVRAEDTAGEAPTPAVVDVAGGLHAVAPAFGSQHKLLRPFHPLGEAIELAGQRFEVHRTTKGPQLALREGGKARHTLTAAETVEVLWTEDGKRSKRLVHLRPVEGEAGAWEYAVVSALELGLPGQRVQIIDVNADGRYDGFGVDAWTRPGLRMLQPLTRELIVAKHRTRIESLAPDGSRVLAVSTRLEGTDAQLTTLAAINRLRAGDGLPPVTLDPLLSAACTAHADYLEQSGWNTYTNPHEEHPDKTGYSKEGDAAARRSLIMGAVAPTQAVESFWRTYYHRVDLVNPLLTRVGIDDGPGWITVIDASGTGGARGANIGNWADPVLSPADGSTSLHAAFCFRGEAPQPVRRPAQRGNALIISFIEALDMISAFEGKLEELTPEGAVPVKTLPAAIGHLNDARGIIPAARMKRRTRYRVTFTYQNDHLGPMRHVATFTTR